MDDVLESELNLREISGGAGERNFTFKNQNIKVLLPNGRSITQQVKLGVIDTENQLITRFSFTGTVMPQEQAFKIATMFHKSFNIPLEELNEWNLENKENQFIRRAFGATSGWGFYPRASMAIESSVNKLYPCVVRCLIEWERKEQDDWSEARVWNELPPPEIPEISLNPPSALTYDRRDAYKEALEEQAEYERELAEQGIVLPHLQVTPQAPKNIPLEESDKTENEDSRIIIPILIICGIAFLVLIGGICLRKKNR